MSLRKIELGHLYFADMVMYTELHFEKIWWFESVILKRCQIVKMHQSIESNIEKQYHCQTSRNSTTTAQGDHNMYFVFDNKMNNDQHFSLDFHHFLKTFVLIYSW